MQLPKMQRQNKMMRNQQPIHLLLLDPVQNHLNQRQARKSRRPPFRCHRSHHHPSRLFIKMQWRFTTRGRSNSNWTSTIRSNKPKTYRYMDEELPQSHPIVEKCALIQSVCRKHGVTLAAAALQFPLKHPSVSSVIVGCRSSWEVDVSVSAVNEHIPEEFWEELAEENLVRKEALFLA